MAGETKGDGWDGETRPDEEGKNAHESVSHDDVVSSKG